MVVQGDGGRGDGREPGHRARAGGAPRRARAHRGAHRARRRTRGGRRGAAPRARARRDLPQARRLRPGLRRRVRRVAPRRRRRPRHPGEQRRRVLQRDRHQLGGARRDGPQDQLLRRQDAHRGAPAAVPPVAGHQQDPQHQLAAWPSQQGEQPVPDGGAPGRGHPDGGGDRVHGVAVPVAGEGRDVGRAGVAQGVDRLLRLQAGPQRLLPAAGAASAGARRPRERQLLLPRLHAHRHDQGLGEARRRGGGRRRRAPRAAAPRRAPHGHLLQVAHAAALLQALTTTAGHDGSSTIVCSIWFSCSW